ncbi:hypothetical protein GEMRC1_002525 [Eukaryota sp. GEM-RC1]
MATLESSTMEQHALSAFSEAAQHLKQRQNFMDADDIAEQMDDLREVMDNAQSVSDAISQPLMDGMGFEEDDIMAELNELENEHVQSELLSLTDSVPSSGTRTAEQQPAAPQPPQRTETDDLEDLKKMVFD